MDKLRKGWEQHLLGELFEFKNGLNTDKSKYGAGCKFVNVMDVFNNDYLIEDKIIGSVQITEKQLFEYKLKYGDVLFNRTSEVPEEIAYSTVYLDDKDAVFGGFVIRARAITDKLNEKFLIYLFQSDKFRTQVIKCGQGAIRANIGQKDLAKIKMEIPPLPEQIKIAEILSTWDNAIQITEKQLANSQQQKKALMQMLLSGEKRVAGFSGEWENIKIKELLLESKITDNVTNSAEKRLTVRLNLKGIEHRVFRGTEANNATLHFVRKAGQFIYGKQNFHKGAFGIIPSEFDNFETSQDIPTFDFTEKVVPMWFYHFCSQELFYTGIENRMTGTGSKRLNPKDFLDIEILVPSLKEQHKIAEILTTADQEIKTLQRKLECLKLEKRALMQRLF